MHRRSARRVAVAREWARCEHDVVPTAAPISFTSSSAPPGHGPSSRSPRSPALRLLGYAEDRPQSALRPRWQRAEEHDGGSEAAQGDSQVKGNCDERDRFADGHANERPATAKPAGNRRPGPHDASARFLGKVARIRLQAFDVTRESGFPSGENARACQKVRLQVVGIAPDPTKDYGCFILL